MQPGERVLQVDGGPGWLAEMIAAAGASVTMTDLSGVAVAKAQARRDRLPGSATLTPARCLSKPDSFDVVISDSQLEHRFDHEHALDELVRVLRPNGRLILLLPNTAHWRMRWWLLRGRFPYLANTPTDWLHLRFFTLPDIRLLLAARGIVITETDGSASLWVRDLYPAFLRKGWRRGSIRGWPGVGLRFLPATSS